MATAPPLSGGFLQYVPIIGNRLSPIYTGFYDDNSSVPECTDELSPFFP